MPEEPGHDLGVEDVGGQGATGGEQDVEILPGGVGHRHARAAEHGGQRGRVHGQGIDQGHLVGPGDLDEGQVRDVRPLGVELGVEAVVLLALEGVDERGQTARVVDHGRDVGGGRHRGYGRRRALPPRSARATMPMRAGQEGMAKRDKARDKEGNRQKRDERTPPSLASRPWRACAAPP